MVFGRERDIAYNGNLLEATLRLRTKAVSGPRKPIRRVHYLDLEMILTDLVNDVLLYYKDKQVGPVSQLPWDSGNFTKILLIDKPSLQVIYNVKTDTHSIIILDKDAVSVTVRNKE